MIDTHAHLQLPAFHDDLSSVVERAFQAGVRAIVVPGTDADDSRQAVALATAYAETPCRVYAAVGVHPTNADAMSAAALDTLRMLAEHPQVVAIGEIGLDYYWPTITSRDWPCAEPAQQRKAFEAQLALAAELGLPVIVHDRDAHEETLAILDGWRFSHPPLRGVLHAYAGGIHRLERALALGFAIGIDGPVTYPKATQLRALAAEIPLERLLLETDAPYLTPVPHRGHRNEPAHIQLIAAEIARLRHISAAEIERATTLTAATVFRLPPVETRLP